MDIFCIAKRGRDRMVVGFITPIQSVSINIKVVSLYPVETRCTRYNIMSVTCAMIKLKYCWKWP